MLLNLEHLKNKYNMQITGILHIGAHYGEEYEEYERLFGAVPIVMWEASPANFDILNAKLGGKNNVTLINRGVGSFECEVPFYMETANTGQSNSVLKPKVHTEQYPGIVFDEISNIKVYPLDKWEPGNAFNFINIDIQGFELHAFMGAKKTLRNVDYIMTEINRAELYENCATVEEIDWYLSRFGFERVETDWAGGTWGDGFYLRK
jgi:FkbM family methyltransferase